MLTVVFSAKGSPGATSSALALAALWPRPVVLVEADPVGSDLRFRARAARGEVLGAAPNLLGVAAAGRRSRLVDVREWAQRLACGVELVVGPATPAQGHGLGSLWPDLAQALVAAPCDVVVDVGRLDPRSGAIELVRRAQVAICVLSASLESVMHTRQLVADLTSSTPGRIVPLLVGRARTARVDRADLDSVILDQGLAAEPAAHLALDRSGLAGLERGHARGSRMRASALMRSARAVAGSVAEHRGVEVAS